MIYSCQYDSSGHITCWQRGSNLRAATSIKDVRNEPGPAAPTWAIVEKFPREVLEHDGKWAMDNLRVSRTIKDNIVEVELAHKV